MQSQNLDIRTERMAMEELCSLACCLWLTQTAFLLTQEHLPKAKEAPCGLSLPAPLISQTMSYRLAHRQSDEGIFVTHE